MSLDSLLTATEGDQRCALAKLGDELLHQRAPALVFFAGLDVRLENRHGLSLPPDVCRGDGGRALSQGWTAPSPIGLPPHQQAGCFFDPQLED